LKIRTDTIGGVPVVSVVGEVDRLSGKTLKRAIGAIFREEGGCPCLLVDLTECSYVDGVALSVLMSIRDRLAPGHCLGLIGASSNIRHLFEVIGFEENENLGFVSSRDEAQKFINKMYSTRAADSGVTSGSCEEG
jgi:anti-anti-sigma factor